MTDVMIDFETLGTKPTSVPVSIGAVAFNPNSATIISKFHRNIDIDSSLAAGLTIGGATVMWWLNQTAEARKALADPPPISIKEMMSDFTRWVKPILGRDGNVWSHGSIFDISIIENIYRTFGESPPWFFTRIMDTRTVFRITSFDFTAWNKARGGVAHNSLDDSIAQVEALSLCWNRISVK